MPNNLKFKKQSGPMELNSWLPVYRGGATTTTWGWHEGHPEEESAGPAATATATTRLTRRGAAASTARTSATATTRLTRRGAAAANRDPGRRFFWERREGRDGIWAEGCGGDGGMCGTWVRGQVIRGERFFLFERKRGSGGGRLRFLLLMNRLVLLFTCLWFLEGL